MRSSIPHHTTTALWHAPMLADTSANLPYTLTFYIIHSAMPLIYYLHFTIDTYHTISCIFSFAHRNRLILKQNFYSLMFLLIQLYNQVVLKFMKSIFFFSFSFLFFLLPRSFLCFWLRHTRTRSPAKNISSPDSVESRISRCVHNIFFFSFRSSCTRSLSSFPSLLLYYHCVVNGPGCPPYEHDFSMLKQYSFYRIFNYWKYTKKKTRAVAVVRDYTFSDWPLSIIVY